MTQTSPEKLTDEEHQARAMLLGLSYHHGNGDPVYFEIGPDGFPVLSSFLDANTLEQLRKTDDDGTKWMVPEGRSAYQAIIGDNIKRTLKKKALFAEQYKGKVQP